MHLRTMFKIKQNQNIIKQSALDVGEVKAFNVKIFPSYKKSKTREISV